MNKTRRVTTPFHFSHNHPQGNSVSRCRQSLSHGSVRQHFTRGGCSAKWCMWPTGRFDGMVLFLKDGGRRTTQHDVAGHDNTILGQSRMRRVEWRYRHKFMSQSLSPWRRRRTDSSVDIMSMTRDVRQRLTSLDRVTRLLPPNHVLPRGCQRMSKKVMDELEIRST
jgi:hypothetical protein